VTILPVVAERALERVGAEPYQQFGRYQLIATLGHGGMADVYLAVSRGPVGFAKLQVVKRLRPNLAEEPEFLAMFLDEARLAARLNHPNVVQTNEVGEAGGYYFIAMEYLDGQPLNRILARSRRMLEPELTLEVLVTIMAEALAGLHYAHNLTDYDGTPLHVVHRDASPHNLFVTYEGQVKLVDFGIAKAANRSVETRAGTLKGKMAYMAPEQARCEAINRRADVFSMGAVLWEVVVGERLWRDPNDMRILDALGTGMPMPSMRSVRPDVPAELDAIATKALAMDPAYRYPTAADMRHDLLGYLERSRQRPTSHEDIGRVVGGLFRDRRGEMKTLIDLQLGALGTAPSAPINLIDLAQLSATGSVRPPQLPHAGVGPRDGSDPGFDKGSQPTLSRAATSESMKPRASRPSRRPIALVALGALAVGGALAFVTLRAARNAAPSAAAEDTTSAVAAPPEPATPTAVEAAASAADPAGPSITIAVEATPEHVRVHLDGREIGSTPYAGELAADDREHELRFEAEGYETETRTLRLDKNLRLVVELEKRASGAVAVASPRTTAGATPKGDVPEPKPAAQPQVGAEAPGLSGRPGKPKKRDLDPSDPWAK
jgi:serine/threonine protein kinase